MPRRIDLTQPEVPAMSRRITLVYEDGVFKPVEPVTDIPEHGRVEAILGSPFPPGHPFEGWVGGLSDEDAAEMIRVIDEEFEQIDPNDWK
jgi:predicted DNA-binding antitoxin AbrB/MazE fold protein